MSKTPPAENHKQPQPPATMEERCIALADRLFAVTQTADIAIWAVGEAETAIDTDDGRVRIVPRAEVLSVKLDDDENEIAGTRRVLVDPVANQRRADEAVQAFRAAIEHAKAGINLVDNLKRRIAKVEVQDWQCDVNRALRNLGGLCTRWDRRLFDKEVVTLREQLAVIQEYDQQLRSVPLPLHCDSVQSEPATADADKPNGRGYVASPADVRAYVERERILVINTIGLQSPGKLTSIIENPTNEVRWTRPPAKSGAPKRNRRSIHLGDWLRYEAVCKAVASDGISNPTPADIQKARAEIDQINHARM